MAKPTNKILKYILVAGGVFIGLLIVLLAAAAIIIPIKYPPAKLKAMATEELTKALKHSVSIGDIHFNVFTGFGITDLKISNRVGWDARPILSAKDISISYYLLPLLWGEVSLGEIKLNQPDILVERRGGNQFNFSDMFADASAAAPAPAPQPAPKAVGKVKARPKPNKKAKKHAAVPKAEEPTASLSFFASPAWADTAPPASAATQPAKSSMAFSIDTVSIVHAKMVYLDETLSPRQESDLSDLNVTAKNISTTGNKTSFSIETPVTYTKMSYQLKVDGAFRYFLAGQSLKELSVKGAVNDLGFQVSGDAQDMTANFTPNMDGEASLDMLKFSGLVPRNLSQMPQGLSLTGPAKVAFHLAGSKKGGLELSGTADGSELAIQYKDLFVKTAKSACKVDFKTINKMDEGIYDVPSFKVTYQDWEVTGAFHYKNGAPWSCEVHSKSLPFKGLPGMLPKLKNATIDGDGSLDLKIVAASKGNLPFVVNGQVALKGIGVTLPNEPYLQSMDGVIYCSDNVIRIPSVNFQTFGGSGAVAVTLNGNNMAYSYGFNFKNVDGQKLVDASVDAYVTKNTSDYKDKIYGTINLAYSGSGKGTSGDAMMSSQVGSGKYSLVNAKVKGFAAIKTINSYLKDKSDEFDFDKIDGVLVMKDKVFTYTMNTTGKVGAIREKGGIQVVQMVYSPDMSVQCDIKKDFIDTNAVQSALPAGLGGLVKTPDFLTDDYGNVPVDLKFTGRVSENHYSWDTGRIGNNIKKKAGKVLQGAAQNAIKQNLGNQLKGLFH